MATLVIAGEKGGRGFAAEIAVDALLVDVKFTAGVVRPLVCFVGHGEAIKKLAAAVCVKVPNRNRGKTGRWIVYSTALCHSAGIPPMLSDRSYMRDDESRGGTSVLTWLLCAISAGFILQEIFYRLLRIGGDLIGRIAGLSVPWLHGSGAWLGVLLTGVR